MDAFDIPSAPDWTDKANRISNQYRLERDAAIQVLARLWKAVDSSNLRGHESTELLEAMTAARETLDAWGLTQS